MKRSRSYEGNFEKRPCIFTGERDRATTKKAVGRGNPDRNANGRGETAEIVCETARGAFKLSGGRDSYIEKRIG